MDAVHDKIHVQLHKVYGFDGFRPYQREIIEKIIEGRDVMAVMPTGGGKSLCFQLPAKILPGATVVISPLISLMKDQVDAARQNGFKAAYLNSSQTSYQADTVHRNARSGLIELLYVSPEKLAMERFFGCLDEIPVSLFAIDEAHCISEWGHDFRPDYLSLSRLAQKFTGIPIACFTASATHITQQDIAEKIGLRNPFVVRASFNRANLLYEVRAKADIDEQLFRFISEHSGEPGIIYRATRDSVDKTAEALKERGIRALPYHAGMSGEDRAANQDKFRRDEIDVIVATIAFGLGIDKPNIRFVLHADLPKNIESYYQETGRAGRDGQAAHCVLFFSYADTAKIKYLFRDIADEDYRVSLMDKFNEMARYASTGGCRRKFLLAYFGETFAGNNCGGCDTCLDLRERVDATDDARLILKTIMCLRERFGRTHIVDVVTGAENARVLQYCHDKLEVYGAGSKRDKRFWYSMLEQLEAGSCIEFKGEYPTARLTETGRLILKGDKRFGMLKAEKVYVRKYTPRVETATPDAGPADPGLLKKLRELRVSIAREKNVPAYVVFHDSVLADMARVCPVTVEEMLSITGVGSFKMENYGEAFLEAIRKYSLETGRGEA